MTKYFDPHLSQETLETYRGYSLQVVASGRIKLSFHRSHRDRIEYYAIKPKRSREAYKSQYDRSASVQPPNYVPFFTRVPGTGVLMFRAW